LQDTPLVRATYSAVIHTDNDVIAVMSAKSDPKAKHSGDYSFVMSDAIPSNLIALAVGDLRFKETGPRSGVYAEKPLLDAAAKEFADTEAMLQAAEKLFGPYRWDRYDVVVLPPGFPDIDAGNPRAPFIAPSAITGDRSLEWIVAHALAESWAGDLVSAATWRDAWIDTGFATYMQDRLVRTMYGERRAAAERVLALRMQKPEEQALPLDLRGKDPGALPREAANPKAGLFFEFLDAKFGRARFDEFMRGYFDHFAFRSITTEQFLAYLKENLLDRSPNIVSSQQVAAWVTGSAVPADAELPASDAYAPVDTARTAWLSGKLPAKKLEAKDWVTQQWLYFLIGMPPVLRKDQLADLDQAFAFTRSANAEVAASWLMLVIRNTYQPGYPRLEQFLETNGRQTLIVPLYLELVKTPAGTVLAKRVYALAKPAYFPRTAAAIDPIVNPASESQDDD
jgi:leukotriene-A4 hydrolase